MRKRGKLKYTAFNFNLFLNQALKEEKSLKKKQRAAVLLSCHCRFTYLSAALLIP